jgi:peptidoglycan/xylan/chitin deacetylase (PgdA/CDA1 family)
MRAKENIIRLVSNVGIGLRAVLGRRSQAPANILMYHRVAAAVAGVPRPTFNVEPEQFHRQLAELQRLGYEFWPLSRLLDAAERSEPVPSGTLVLTFDDGFECILTQALPVLEELQVPATAFICTGLLDSEAPLPFDDWAVQHCRQLPRDAYMPLTRPQCRELLDSGWIEIGAHTCTHNDFRGHADELLGDLQACLAFLRTEFGIDQPTFAFPFGRVDEGFAERDLVKAARQAGVRCALTTDPCPVDLQHAPFCWGRFNVFPWDSGRSIDARLSGWYRWLPLLRRKICGIVAGAQLRFSGKATRITSSEPTR